jgi:hypothetical protein
MRSVLKTLLVGCCLVVLTNAAAVQTPPTAERPPEPVPPSTAPGLNTITVEGKREVLEKQVNTFVSSVMVHSDIESLARWRNPICPTVAGLPKEQGDFLVARLAEVAAKAGAPEVAPANCVANFYVIATSDPVSVLKQWRARDPKMFGNRGEITINSFINTARPVRVWYNGIPVAAEGPGLQDRKIGGALSNNYLQSNARAQLSRVKWDDVVALSSVIVVIDPKKFTNINAGQLEDYVSMVGLAEVHLEADVGGVPTVLNLFSHSGDAAPLGLSNWDQAFLQSLYNTAQEQKSQLSAIETLMFRTVSP